MVSNDVAEDKAHKDYQYLVSKLNLDPTTATVAWDSYDQVRSKFTLEGDNLHWLGCAIFVACRNSITPTVGQTVLEGNCVSLTSLLRHSNLSLVHFFNKIKNWADMTKMSDEFHRKIDNLQSKVAVDYNIFKEYAPLFTKVFQMPVDSDNKQHRNRKQKSSPCSPMKVFEFCWLMFITAKGEDELYSKDLVPSYHLLYACIDWAFKNALLDDRKDLLNPNFSALPEDFSIPDYKVPKEAPCIIAELCESEGDILTDAKYVKEYKFKGIIRDWFDKGILQGSKENFLGIFNPAVFDTNLKNATKAYEAHLLNKGDFDERIFLAEHKRQQLLREQNITNGNQPNVCQTGESLTADGYSPDFQPQNEGIQQCMSTPLTGRRFLGPRDHHDTSPSGGQTASKLQNLLAGRGPNASEDLQKIFKSCVEDPTESIKEVVRKLSEKFNKKYTEHSVNVRNDGVADVTKRIQTATTLFYKFLENVLKNENTKLQDISPLVQKTIFCECLFVCSLEIVEFSFNTSKKFPWILSATGVTAFDFVKVIELTIRSGDQLPREIVKHLSFVEERILESILWESNSALWEAIAKSGEQIPKFEDIALPGNMVYNNKFSSTTRTGNIVLNAFQSPGPSALESFQSPNINNSSAQAPISAQVKKNLFPAVKPGQSLLQTTPTTTAKCHLLVTDEEGNKKYVRLMDTPTETPVATPTLTTQDVKPRKGGSLCIIFRKFYNLAGVRMEDLCQRLEITPLELRCKIWTIFEHAIRHTDLIKDRHLDQLLMCSIYIVCRVTRNIEKTFVDIMKCYREQPQANNHVYRKVLMSKEPQNGENNDNAESEVRDDLIKFYNYVFMLKMKEIALKFTASSGNQSGDLHLSPIPAVKSIAASPKHQISKNFFIKAYESPVNTFSSAKKHSYYFSRSASKELSDINNAINTGIIGKRLLDTYEPELPNKRPANKKVVTLLEERKVQSMEQD